MANEKLSTQQRMANFSASTRQNWQQLPAETVTSGARTVQFSLPKARLLSRIWLKFDFTVSIKHASGTAPTTDLLTPGRLIRKISLDFNNGFQPFYISGTEAMLYNAVRLNPAVVFPQSENPQGYCYMPELQASAAGTTNKFSLTLDLPVVLNDRDLIGLYLLQSNETNVTLSIDIGNDNELLDNASGYTVTINTIKITPTVETYSVPVSANAMPDVSVLKLVSARQDTFPGAGQNVIKLNTGTIYRKIIMYVTDATGKPFEDEDFLSSIELVFNQADVPYSVDSAMLHRINEWQLGYALPKGVYVFDFSTNGIPNMGGTRGMIDSAGLSEFWVRFNSSKAGKIHIINENIARLV